MNFGMDLNFGNEQGNLLEPIIASTGTISPTEYANALYDREGGTMAIDLTYATPYNYAANEVSLYLGDAGFRDRTVQSQWDGSSPEGELRTRVRVNNIETFAEDKNLTISFLPPRQKHSVRYNAEEGSSTYYLNGIKVFEKTSGLTFADQSDMLICAGKIAGTTSLNTSGTINDFVYYGVGAGQALARSLSNNYEVVSGLTGDSARRGIVFAGQSNSSGRATATPTYTNTIYNLANDGTYGSYTDPYDDATGTLIQNSLLSDASAAVGYAGYCIDDLADDGEEYFSCAANKGGTAISTWAAFAAGAQADSVIQDRAYAFINRIKMAQQAANGRLPVVVWHQGESDAEAGTASATYKATWKALMDEARAACGNFPIIVLSLHEYNVALTATEANWNRISGDLLELPSEYSNTYGYDISSFAGQTGDRVHLSDASDQSIGVGISNIIQVNNLF